jgi:hypothetical protein
LREPEHRDKRAELLAEFDDLQRIIQKIDGKVRSLWRWAVAAA